MPPEAFYEAYDIVADDGWIAFNIKADFTRRPGLRPASAADRRPGPLRARSRSCDRVRYRHRLSMHREPLDYVAVVGRKRGTAVASAA